MKFLRLIVVLGASMSATYSSQNQLSFYEKLTSPFKYMANMYTSGYGEIFKHDQRTENSFVNSLQSNPVISCSILYAFQFYLKKHGFQIPKTKNLKLFIVSFSCLYAQSLLEPQEFNKDRIIYSTKNLALTPLKFSKNSFYGEMYHKVDIRLKNFENKNINLFNNDEERKLYNSSITGLYTLIPSIYFGMHKCLMMRLGLGISVFAPFLSFLYEKHRSKMDELL